MRGRNTDAESVHRKLANSLKGKCYPDDLVTGTVKLLRDLVNNNVDNVARLETKLRNAADNKQDFLDIWTEGWAASLFSASQFDVIYEPCREAGPDLSLASRGHVLFVEVRRFRESPEEREEAEQSIADGRAWWGPSPDDSVNMFFSKITEKSRQSVAGKPYVILTKCMRTPEDKTIAKWTIDELSKHKEYADISGVLFDSGWRDVATGQRFHFYHNQQAATPLDPAVASRLQNPVLTSSDALLQKYGHTYPPL